MVIQSMKAAMVPLRLAGSGGVFPPIQGVFPPWSGVAVAGGSMKLARVSLRWECQFPAVLTLNPKP